MGGCTFIAMRFAAAAVASAAAAAAFLFCSSMSINMASLRVVSEIAIVPDSECRTPTLTVQSAAMAAEAATVKAAALFRVFANLIILNSTRSARRIARKSAKA